MIARAPAPFLYVQHHVIAADRPTIVFLHDSLGCTALWRSFPEALGSATDCNVLMYDRQGYGRSDPFAGGERALDYLEREANVLQELLVQYKLIGQAILFGHSDGGSIALLAAARYPSSVQAIITEGAHVFVEAITLQGIRAAVEAYRTTSLPDRLHKYHGDKTDAVFRAWADTWLSDDFGAWTIEPILARIRCPVLVIQGEQDEYGTLAQVTSIVRQVAGEARSLLIPGVGHTPHRDARPLVLKLAAAFIQKLAPVNP